MPSRKQPKRYSDDERAKIIAEATQQKLSGQQVAKKFGISPATYYLWRSKDGGVRGLSGSGDGIGKLIVQELRAAVRKKTLMLRASIVREEVARSLK